MIRASLMLLLLAVPVTWADHHRLEDRPLTEEDLLADLTPISAASRLHQRRFQAPAAVTVIDRPMIDASGATEISDLLRLVPGFQAYHVNGHKFGVTAHGQGSTHPGRLEVMVNGRSVYLPLLSTVDWRALGIGLKDIDRIEVVRGPAVATWGANAFQGAVNIITRSPLASRGTGTFLQAGDPDSRRLALNHSDQLGPLSLRTSAGLRESDGFGVNDEGQSGYLNLRGVLTPSLLDTLELELGISRGEAGIGDRLSLINERDFESHYQFLTWQRELGSDHSLQLRFYHNALRYRMEKALLSQLPLGSFLDFTRTPDEPTLANLEHGSTHRYDLELQHQRRPNSAMRILWGGGVRLDQATSAVLFNSPATQEAWFWRAFGHLEWTPAPDWTWNFSTMVEHSAIADTEVSPRLALNYRLGPMHTLRASIAQAYRTPSLLEANQDSRVFHSNGTEIIRIRAADPDLDAARNRTLTLGYLARWPRHHLDLDLKLYWEQIEDGIGRARIEDSQGTEIDFFDPTSNVNNADWTNRGLEAQLRYQPGPDRWFHLAYAYLDTDGDMEPGPLDPEPDAPGFDLDDKGPHHTLALLASQGFGHGYQLSGALYRQSRTQWINGADTAGYTRLDLRLARTLHLGASEATLALLVQNLGGEYREFQDRNRFGTRTLVSVDLRF